MTPKVIDLSDASPLVLEARDGRGTYRCRWPSTVADPLRPTDAHRLERSRPPDLRSRRPPRVIASFKLPSPGKICGWASLLGLGLEAVAFEVVLLERVARR